MEFLCTSFCQRYVKSPEEDVVACIARADKAQTKGKTLEEISIIFGDTVGFTEVQHFTKDEVREKDEEERIEVAS